MTCVHFKVIMEDQIGKSRKVLYNLESDKKLLAKTYGSSLDFSYPAHPYSSYPEQIDFLFILTFIYFCLSDYIDLSFYLSGLALFSFFFTSCLSSKSKLKYHLYSQGSLSILFFLSEFMVV